MNGKLRVLLNRKTYNSIKVRNVMNVCEGVIIAILAISITSFIFSRFLLNREIDEKTQNKVSQIQTEVESILFAHARVPIALARLSESLGSEMSKKQYQNILTGYLLMNKDTFGCGVWYEPFARDAKTKFFGPYVYRDKDKVVYTEEYETEKYNYPGWDWYKIGKTATAQVVWSAPFYDEGTKVTMLTANAPFYDKDKKYIGSASGDIDMTSIQNLIANIKYGETGRAFLLGTDSLFLAHPDPARVMKVKATEDKNSSLAALGRVIMSRNSPSIGSYKNENGTQRVYYSYLPETGWRLGLAISENELYAPLTILALIISAVSVILLLLSTLFGVYVAKKISKPIVDLNTNVQRLAAGDLSLTEEYHKAKKWIDTEDDGNELHMLVRNYWRFVVKLREVILGVNHVSQEVASSTEEMAATITSFADNAQQQAAAAEQITATVEEITAGMESIAISAEDQFSSLTTLIEQIKSLSVSITNMEDVIREASGHSAKINKELQSGDESLRSMNDNMGKIAESSKAMSNIVEMITGISEQINLLALNAAIEAARAGDAGRGFAVVADEIGKLADQTATSIKEISSLINENENEIQKGMTTVVSAIETISAIIQGINEIAATIERINSFMKSQVDSNTEVNREVDLVKIKSDEIRVATGEQKLAVEEISKSISNINQSTQSNAAGAEEMSGTSESVASMAQELKEKVDFFKA
jgi:methyl-accepting chemotaxis protein